MATPRKRPSRARSNGNGHTETNGNGHDTAMSGLLASTIPMGVLVGKREEWFKLAEEYGECMFRMWVNHPPALRDQVYKGTSEERRAALHQILLEHNGWRYLDGEGHEVEYPPMNTPEFWDTIPTDMAVTLILRMGDEAQALPFSLSTPKSNSDSTSPSATPQA